MGMMRNVSYQMIRSPVISLLGTQSPCCSIHFTFPFFDSFLMDQTSRSPLILRFNYFCRILTFCLRLFIHRVTLSLVDNECHLFITKRSSQASSLECSKRGKEIFNSTIIRVSLECIFCADSEEDKNHNDDGSQRILEHDSFVID